MRWPSGRSSCRTPRASGPARASTATSTSTGSRPCAAPRSSGGSRCAPAWISPAGPCACAWRTAPAWPRRRRAEGDFAPARDPGAARKAIRDALERLGDSPFALAGLDLAEPRFVPVSRLNALRREAAAALEALRRAPRDRPGRPAATRRGPCPTRSWISPGTSPTGPPGPSTSGPGAKVLEPAAELQEDLLGRVVMTTRHCLRFELGWCPVHANPEPWKRLAGAAGPALPGERPHPPGMPLRLRPVPDGAGAARTLPDRAGDRPTTWW